MNLVMAIIRRDMKRWFSDPTGYVFIALFVLLSAYGLFWANDEFFNNNLANFAPLNNVFPLLLLFIIPAITMTVWASEKAKGTDELLLTLPVKDSQIILGKFLAAVGIYTTALFFCFPLLLALDYLGDPDYGLMICNFLAYWLLGTMLISVGMVGSQLSSNMTVAFILGVILCAAVAFAEKLLPGSWERFGPLAHFEDMGKGKLSVSGLILFGGITAAFLYLNHLILSSRHWSARADEAVHIVTRFVCLLVAAISLSVWGSRVVAHADATSEKIHSVSLESKRLIQGLDPQRPVYIQAYLSPMEDVPREYVEVASTLRNLLAEFDGLGGDQVEVNIVDTERYTDEAREAEERFDIRFETVGTERDGRPDSADLFLGVAFSSGVEQTTIPFMHRGLSVEYELCRSIRYVTGLTPLWVPVRTGPAFTTRDRAEDWATANWSGVDHEVEERGDNYFARVEGSAFEARPEAESWVRENWLASWAPWAVEEVGGKYRVIGSGPSFDSAEDAQGWIEDHLADGPYAETEVQEGNGRHVPRGLSADFDSESAARQWASDNVAASAEIEIDRRQLRRKIGILDNDIKIFGDFDQQSMRSSPAWQIKDELELQYDVERVPVDAEYPGDLEALIALMPSTLNQEQMDRLQDYIDAGNPTLLIDDPWPWSAPGQAPSDPKGGHRNPFMSQGQPPPEDKGDIEALLRSLNLRWDSNLLCWDSYNPHPPLSRLEKEVVFVSAGSGSEEAFGSGSPVSSGLQELMLWFPGTVEDDLTALRRDVTRLQDQIDEKKERKSEIDAELKKLGDTQRKLETEVSAQGGAAAPRELQFKLLLATREITSLENERRLIDLDLPGLEGQLSRIDDRIADTQQRLRDRGVNFEVLLRSSPDSGTHSVDDGIDKGFPPFQPPRPRPGRKLKRDTFEHHFAYKVTRDRGEGKAPVQVIFIADLDFMSDQFFEIRRLGLEYLPRLDNISFLLNAVDDLAGDDTFIALRKRRPQLRSLTRIERLEQDFEDDWLLAKTEAETKAEDELEKAQKSLDEKILEIEENPNIDARSKEIQKATVQSIEQRKLDLAKARIDRDKERALELAKTEKLDSVKGIHRRVKVLWAAIAPLPAILVGLLAFVLRRSRERSTIRSAGGR